ncbi:hypothetical protein MHYP_G00059950 [Metynnis hypsauchen]
MKWMQLFSKWSEEVLTHSTVVGRVWLTVLFFFRVFMLMVGVDVLAQDKLVCKTLQPGCDETCRNVFFPVLPVRFWWAQIVFASAPTLLYLTYAMHVTYGEAKPSEKASGNVRKSVMFSYFAQLLVKIILEVAFIVAQYFLYGFVIDTHFDCMTSPCPHRVDCYFPQAAELTVFSIYTLVVTCVSVALNALEGLLLFRKLRRQTQKRRLSSSCLTDVSAKQLTNNLCDKGEAYVLKQINE